MLVYSPALPRASGRRKVVWAFQFWAATNASDWVQKWTKRCRALFWTASETIPGQVRSACTPRWQPCVRAQATLYKKKHYHYLPVMKATNSDSKRCQVSVDVSFQSPSCFQRKKARTFSSQAKGGRPYRPLLGGVQSKQRRNYLCGGNVLMYAANFQYLILTTADHGKNAKWCTTVSMRACHECRITCQGADQSIPTGGGIMRRNIFRISMSDLCTSLGYSVRWPAAKQATGVITALKNFRRKPSGMFLSHNIHLCTNDARAALCKWCTSKWGHSNPNDVDQTFTFNGRLEKISWCKALKLHRPQSSTGFSVAKHEFHLDKMVFGQGGRRVRGPFDSTVFALAVSHPFFLGCGHGYRGRMRRKRQTCVISALWHMISPPPPRKNYPVWYGQNHHSNRTRSLKQSAIIHRTKILAFWAMIKCPICSYQCDNWYVPNWRQAVNVFLGPQPSKRRLNPIKTETMLVPGMLLSWCFFDFFLKQPKDIPFFQQKHT